MTGPLLLTAWLDVPLAGDPPQLDALLEWSLSSFQDDFQAQQRAGLPHFQIDRSRPAPPPGTIPIPVLRRQVGRWPIALCSSPILPLSPGGETVDYINKRLGVEHASLLSVAERKVVNTTNCWTKSYRLPLRIRAVPCVRWFCVGNERNLRKALRYVHAIGKKVADGYGRVREWTTETARGDCSWFAPHESGTILMRPLPLQVEARPWLPDNLMGCRQHFGACVPPYWHPDRFTEIVIPC